MRALIYFGLLVAIALPAFSNDEVLPEGTIKKGSLANAKLIADAKLGVAAKVGVMGCAKPERLEPMSSRCQLAFRGNGNGKSSGSYPAATANFQSISNSRSPARALLIGL